jgi:hypothetical protein
VALFTSIIIFRCPGSHAPLLRMKMHADEPFSARDIRSAQRADIIGYSDACTGNLAFSAISIDAFAGIGGYIPG